MLQNAYLLAKTGADTAENERNFAQNLLKKIAIPLVLRRRPWTRRRAPRRGTCRALCRGLPRAEHNQSKNEQSLQIEPGNSQNTTNYVILTVKLQIVGRAKNYKSPGEKLQIFGRKATTRRPYSKSYKSSIVKLQLVDRI